LIVKPVYYDKGCHGNHCAYYHTLMVENFEDTCFRLGSTYDFIRLADEYLDSVKTDTPVAGITFIRSFDFNPHYDGRDTEPLHEHTILDIDYNEDSWGSKVPEIDGVGYWVNGERKGLDYLQVKIRKQGMSVYDSKKQK